jgi:hypothetical protein
MQRRAEANRLDEVVELQREQEDLSLFIREADFLLGKGNNSGSPSAGAAR